MDGYPCQGKSSIHDLLVYWWAVTCTSLDNLSTTHEAVTFEWKRIGWVFSNKNLTQVSVIDIQHCISVWRINNNKVTNFSNITSSLYHFNDSLFQYQYLVHTSPGNEMKLLHLSAPMIGWAVPIVANENAYMYMYLMAIKCLQIWEQTHQVTYIHVFSLTTPGTQSEQLQCRTVSDNLTSLYSIEPVGCGQFISG